MNLYQQEIQTRVNLNKSKDQSLIGILEIANKNDSITPEYKYEQILKKYQ